MKQTFMLLLLAFLPMAVIADVVKIDGIYYDLNKEGKTAAVAYRSSGILYSGTVVPGYPGVTGRSSIYNGNIIIPEIVEFNDTIYNVTSIAPNAFNMCRELSSITIPNTITSIGENAFLACTSLSSIIIPSSVVEIGKEAFRYCSGLKTISISCSPNSVGHNIFYGCISTSMIIYDTEEVAPLLGGVGSSNLEVTLTDKVRKIDDYAFSGCTFLSSLTIPNCVTYIGRNAFSGCSSLISLAIPDGITNINDGTFSGCCGLTSVGIPNSVNSIGNSAFSGCSSLTSIDIPTNVNSIGNWAFSDCISLSSFSIPSNISTIEEYTFYGCSGLISVEIPNSIKAIKECAFAGCSGLTSISIPDNVTTIDIGAFQECSSLSSLSIGKGIHFIYDYAFANCPELLDVYCLSEKVPLTDSKVFKDTQIDLGTLHVPEQSVDLYGLTAPWSQFGTIVETKGEDGDYPKCATPTICYVNGKVVLTCETEDVEFVSVVTPVVNTHHDSEFMLDKNYKITVYAIKEGYNKSDSATMEILAMPGDVNGDGNVNAADIAKLVEIILGKNKN